MELESQIEAILFWKGEPISRKRLLEVLKVSEVEINESNILSPADGTVVAIEEVEEKEYFHDRRIQVSVFMSPFNVHANWYPISGKIDYIKYHPGKHLVAYNPKSSFENEMSTIVIKSSNQCILVRQIAGIMARRIIYYAKQDEDIIQGSELGFIKFGSRLDILLPLNSNINVKLNERVKGKLTVIAKIDTIK